MMVWPAIATQDTAEGNPLTLVVPNGAYIVVADDLSSVLFLKENRSVSCDWDLCAD